VKEKKISNYQAISIIVTVMISHIILNLPNHLISETGPSTILKLRYVFIITLIIFGISAKIFKLFPNSDIMDICEYAAGKKLKNILGIIICLYLITISAFVIRIFAESLVLLYFPNIDLEIIILIFIISTAIMNLLGFKAVSRIGILFYQLF